MIPYPHINPEIFRIGPFDIGHYEVGPFAVRWYGLMYLIGFAASFLIVRHQVRKKGLAFGDEFVETLYTYLILGLLLGARIGYVLFYNAGYYWEHPLEVFAITQGGMSFHGGFIGVVLGGLLFCRKYKSDVWMIADLVAVTAPIGLGLGRIGNFINGELYGRVTDVPWAMIFPGESLPRHPSQLYEFFLEGVVLFVIMWMLKGRFRSGVLFSLFLILYGVFRTISEFFRQPDPQIGYILGIITMGQILSVLMIAAGTGLFLLRNRRQ
ncbi:MAG TPA: prolipoprotein diacylglyceryl transferase [Dissulfurispiraceae bacterium]|nr:prolipoprotein diacylglyceryl transferase [Dissulfurispiraceae bacterium]